MSKDKTKQYTHFTEMLFGGSAKGLKLLIKNINDPLDPLPNFFKW